MKNEQKVINAEGLKGELNSNFVMSVSHHFRTSLTVIQSNLGLLKMQLASLKNSRQIDISSASNRMSAEVNRMTDLLNRIGVLGEIQAGSIEPELKRVDITLICENVLARFNARQSDGRNILLEVSGTEQALDLDVGLMDDILSILISNALLFSGGKPVPKIAILFNEKRVAIKIEDFGIGIPEEDLPYVFNAFYRASNAEQFPGFGLGLFIAAHYINLCGGTIHVESEPGKKTSFITEFKLN